MNTNENENKLKIENFLEDKENEKLIMEIELFQSPVPPKYLKWIKLVKNFIFVDKKIGFVQFSSHKKHGPAKKE